MIYLALIIAGGIVAGVELARSHLQSLLPIAVLLIAIALLLGKL